MTIENPPKLWAYLAPAIERGGAHDATDLRVFASGNEQYANEGRATAVSYYLDGRVSPVQAYVREDIASADVASLAVTWGALQAKHETESTALRRERDALLAVVARAIRCLDDEPAGEDERSGTDAAYRLLTKAIATGKGVG